MKFHHFSTAACVIALALGAASASAATFSGSDDGANVGGPFTSSAAAQVAFLAAAATYGGIVSNDFEGIADGYSSAIALSGATLTTGPTDFGAGVSGVNSTTIGNLYGFNTTAGGSKWFGFPSIGPAVATFTLDAPSNSFGFWLSGVQSSFTTAISLTQLDGSLQTFALPINVNGGTTFFGFTDDTAFTTVSITLDSSGEAFGIDDVSFNTSAVAVPEPATWAMLVTGFGLAGVAVRRRRRALAA